MSNFKDILKCKSILIKKSSKDISPEDFINDKHPIIVKRTNGDWSKGKAIDINHLTGDDISYSFTILLDGKKIKYKQFYNSNNYLGEILDDKLFDFIYNKMDGTVANEILLKYLNEYID